MKPPEIIAWGKLQNLEDPPIAWNYDSATLSSNFPQTGVIRNSNP